MEISQGDDPLLQQLQQQEREAGNLPHIEQAKGMLLQDFGLNDTEALEVLAVMSRQTNTPVGEVADQIVQILAGSSSVQTSRSTADALGELTRELGEGSAGSDLPQLPDGDPDSAPAAELRAQIVTAMQLVQTGPTIGELAEELGTAPEAVAHAAAIDTDDWSMRLPGETAQAVRAELDR
ncbi:MAG TPA: ANTAR domain-containing protein [Nocardioidaceae bacterium]|nr:ANTAR domain-containing protein [Nocardioidaceae bacterium]